MVERFDIATVHLCGQEPRGKMIAHEDGEYIRYSDYEAALRAAVPEGEPVAWRYISSAKGAKWTVQKNYPEQVAKWGGYKIEPLYTRPAPRPDMERELAEARAEMAVAKQEAAAMREQSVKNARERNALAADKARYAETLSVISKSLRGQHAPRYEMADMADAALSGASIPAPDKAEARREALEDAAIHARCAFDDRPRRDSFEWNDGFDDGTKAAATAIRAIISTPARREGE